MQRGLLYLACGVLAYLLGSVSSGILVSRVMKGPDLRKVGSGNTGATNVQRTMGWLPGLLTFAGDVLKAILACWIGEKITGSHNGALFAGICVVIGHNWPLFFQFRGGKGVASSLGVMLICYPIPALISYGLGLVVVLLTKYVSLASMSILTLYAVLVSCFFSGGDFRIILWSVILAVMCIARHHANISRLLQGKENRFGQKVR